MKTVKLYDQDAYAVSFDAKVIFCEKSENGYEVVLDRTLFFPEEGGQSPDQGTLSNHRVIDVQIRLGVIYHTVEASFLIGQKVHGEIDFTHRFSNMQQHTGEHIFSGLVHARFGYDNVGFHLSDQTVTMDFSGPMTEEEVLEIELKANEVIINNLLVEVSYPTQEALRTLVYRSKIEIKEQVRIVTIKGVDVCACCAPHVRRTGEIGVLKVISVQNYKGGVRISLLCGYRALRDYAERLKLLTQLGTYLSTSQDALFETVSKLKASTQSLKSQVISLKREQLEYELAKVKKDQKDVLLFLEELDPQIVREAVNTLVKEHDGICGIFTKEEKGYKFILGSSFVDLRETAKILKEKLDARGGGSKAMIQGSVNASKQAIKQVILG